MTALALAGRLVTTAGILDGGVLEVRLDGTIGYVGAASGWSGPAPQPVDTVAPGYVDIHCHGGGSHTVTSRDPAEVAAHHLSRGTTTMLASLVSASTAELVAAITAIASVAATGSPVVGCHVEGPFLDPAHRGAHDPAHLRLPGVRRARQLAAPTPTSASTARTSAPRPASCRCCNCSGPTPPRSPPTRRPAAGAAKPPATAASSNGSTCSSPKPMPADHDELTRVEAACAELAAAGRPVTFAELAARAQISRTTLYRRADLRAIVEEHRARGQDATTLSGLAVQIDQLRRSLEAVAAKVRRHEETIRRLERTRRKPG
jgi:hypothetical protein